MAATTAKNAIIEIWIMNFCWDCKIWSLLWNLVRIWFGLVWFGMVCHKRLWSQNWKGLFSEKGRYRAAGELMTKKHDNIVIFQEKIKCRKWKWTAQNTNSQHFHPFLLQRQSWPSLKTSPPGGGGVEYFDKVKKTFSTQRAWPRNLQAYIVTWAIHSDIAFKMQNMIRLS